MYVMNKKWDSITNIAQCTSVYVSPEHEIKAVPTGGGNVYRLGQYETAEIARAVLNDLYMHIPTGCIYDAEMNIILGMARLVPGTIWNFYYQTQGGPPGVLGVETEQETIGRNDFVDGKAKLLYLPARQLGV